MILNDKKFCLIGAGGFGREALCCLLDMFRAQGHDVRSRTCFMVEDAYYTADNKIMGVDVLPLSAFDPALYQVAIAIGDSQIRKRVVASLPPDTTYGTIIHPSVLYSEWVEVGEGSILNAGSIVTCNIQIGRHAQLHIHSAVSHDCVIGDFFTASPAALVSGNCSIGSGVYLGTNSAIRQKISICDDAFIGMGTVVVKDITEPGVYAGNPARLLCSKHAN
ncbi:MAG TPA: NeuD/PglB/VioB family sugar acetyltransferase [Saprospiraceae bacterium]|nr:NeuD/PglB/VioB family sugar acetyltransferase [Saprospiraceae bacterium]HND88964.1 NeuD/PglB/VioB family sugar acetyltransferase [Saprospiraceae bacterium]HNG88981.1 NeuD/PglB/VioB family sugar acetyltransferase [Saprospiraceae bacterium]